MSTQSSNAPRALAGRGDEAIAAVVNHARTQYERLERDPLSLDLTRGKPSAEQLDLSARLLALPTAAAMRSASVDVRNYGGIAGMLELRTIFAELLGVDVELVYAEDNASLSIMYDLVSWMMAFGAHDSDKPWNREEKTRWLCPVPGYDRHFSITEAFGIEMIPVPLREGGPDMDVVERLVAADASIKGMWCVPIFANPTGVTYSDHVVQRLASMPVAAGDFRVIWDNAYVVHTLSEDFPKVPNVLKVAADAGHPHRFWQVCSTSKITFAGSGVAFLSSSNENMKWYAKHAGIRKIGPNKVNQLAHAEFFGSASGVREHMSKHQRILRPKFDAVAEILQDRLGQYSIAQWTRPEGGYFVDLEVPKGTARRIVELAAGVGIALTPAGAAFPYGQDPEDKHIRLAPSMPSPRDVAQAIDGVATCVLLAAAEALTA